MTRLTNTELMDSRKVKFLEAYALTGVIKSGTDAADVSRSTYKYWRKVDEDFHQACDDAYQCAVDVAERELRVRGVDGVEEVVLYRGEPVWRRDALTGDVLLDDEFNPIPFTVFKRSDRLLEVYTKAHRPIYKEKSEVAVTGPDGGPVQAEVRIVFVDPPKSGDAGEG